MPFLIEQGQQPLIIRLTSSPFTIGRSSGCEFILPRDTVSREHATFRDKGKGWSVRNHSRINPVMVNQAIVVTERQLVDGDEVRLGSSAFRFTFTAPNEAEISAVATEPYAGRVMAVDALTGPVVLSGKVDEQSGAAGVLSLVNNAGVSGRVSLLGPKHKAHIWVANGTIVQIQAGTSRDADAIGLLGAWEFDQFLVTSSAPPARTLGSEWTLTRVMLELGRLIDSRRKQGRAVTSTKSLDRSGR